MNKVMLISSDLVFYSRGSGGILANNDLCRCRPCGFCYHINCKIKIGTIIPRNS